MSPTTALPEIESAQHADSVSNDATASDRDQAAATGSTTSRLSMGRTFAAWATITLMLVGAVLGSWWQAARATTTEAASRVAFVEDVGYGNLDAERSLIVNDDSAVEAGLSVDGVQSVELIVPPSRSFIDIVAIGDSERSALEGADAVATELVATELAIRTSDIEAVLDDVAMSIELLDDELTTLEASLLEEAETEADANALLTTDLSADERAEVSLTARLANDEFWAITRERNALLDLRNSYVKDQTSSQNDLRTAGNLRIVARSAVTPTEGLDPELSAPLGGALLGLGCGLFGFWVLRRQRSVRP